ncbi:4-O-beta-D-mannosyl-D-glucose phosphorylase [Flavobacterium bizetiae]|uniref:4-O-beta-D-mannosyl-D-glucose phosphorylase n=1 Tax=Flavobacterium bizetiae TaxID=2704140 RepID=A0A6J4GJ84_9FLAO|nr:glycosidase [Flavobacterium bizetiae]CAA9199225.1 4-O-beta-D-mannosyl-D-glucose phosphorylase [Flavobacterium bizetiae]CAD5342247.1 4-O-beta-D-mannosyl-D-glucose phosphorylase [Flavobacterium bizetiae]CAD5348768.1 4-O-beta-D-mannosyl-D-glucose phosphorylase [Flavobacterium bizetiae]
MTAIASSTTFQDRKVALEKEHTTLIGQKNAPQDHAGNGIYERYKNPVVTAAHVPLNWRFDLNEKTNPFLQERIGMNAAFNAGAMKWKGKYLLAVRVEGIDRKSFFAIAESPNGVDNFKFWDKPCVIPQTEEPDTNVYDMRLIHHEDGWIYGIFCTERKDPKAPKSDTSSAVANAGIVRTKDLINWERLPDLISNTGQQRNVVLHPEFVNGKYALYTRPQDGFIDVGAGGGIGLGYVDDMTNPIVKDEKIIFGKQYHTIYELKNGLGPAPIKTEKGWLHLAHGVRNTAAGLRYTLYMFMTDLNDISKVTHVPAGHFMGPEGIERVGDVSNVLFSNGWIEDTDGTVYVYYASSDTRMHVAVSSVEKLVDYVVNTPADTFISAGSVKTIINQIDKNNTI